MLDRARTFCIAAAVLLLAGCGSSADSGAVRIALIGDRDAPFETGLRLSMPGQQVRAATVEGLVGLDATGEVIPALAERWIVTDDGMSYIFRLRNSDWPDGRPMTAEQVRDALRRTLRDLSGTSLGLDLAPVSEVRAMTGRVIEIRLSSPMPDLLQLLAQPEMGVFHRQAGSGPMTLERDERAVRLSLLPPEARGLPTSENWREGTRVLAIRALPSRAAVDAFVARTQRAGQTADHATDPAARAHRRAQRQRVQDGPVDDAKVTEVLGGFTNPTDMGGVAYWAHAGGFLAGIILCLPAFLRRGGPAFWRRTAGHPDHPEASYAPSRLPVVRRRR